MKCIYRIVLNKNKKVRDKYKFYEYFREILNDCW